MKTVLLICTGNTCRSPMAEGLLRHALGDESGFRVVSAGVAAAGGSPASPETLSVLKESGIDLSQHRSKPVTASLVREASIILVMTAVHREIMVELFPEARERVFLLSEFARDPTLRDIPDPIGSGRAAYFETRDAIVAAIPALLTFLREGLDLDQMTPSS